MGFSKNPLLHHWNLRWLRSIILKIHMMSIFFCWDGPIWIKFRRLVHNDMSTAVIWSKSKPDVEFQYGGHLGELHGMSFQSHLPHCRVLPPGEFSVMIPQLCVTLQRAATGRIQRHVIPELRIRIALQGAATWWIHCHDSRATLQGVIVASAILKIVFRHMLFCFLMQFGL